MNQKQIEHLQEAISWLEVRLEKCRPQDEAIRSGLKALLASDKALLALNLIIDQNSDAALAGDESAIYKIQWAEELLTELAFLKVRQANQ